MRRVLGEKASANLSAFTGSAMELKVSAELINAASSQMGSVREDLLMKMFSIVNREGATMVGH